MVISSSVDASSMRPNRDAVAEALMPLWSDMVGNGSTLPSEEELARLIGVSRPTVREALIRMEARGLIRRHQGAGTFANPAALDAGYRLDDGPDFADSLRAVGFDVVIEILDAAVVPLPHEPAAQLHAVEGIPTLRTVKRWRADGAVAVVAVDHVPLHRSHRNESVLELASRPVSEIASMVGLGGVDWICTWPTAVEADPLISQRMEYETGRAVLQMEQVGLERHGVRVFHALEHHRSGIVQYGVVRTLAE